MAIEALTLVMVATIQPRAAVAYKAPGEPQKEWQWECAVCADKWVRDQAERRKAAPEFQDPLDVLHASDFMHPGQGRRCSECDRELENVSCLAPA